MQPSPNEIADFSVEYLLLLVSLLELGRKGEYKYRTLAPRPGTYLSLHQFEQWNEKTKVFDAGSLVDKFLLLSISRDSYSGGCAGVKWDEEKVGEGGGGEGEGRERSAEYKMANLILRPSLSPVFDMQRLREEDLTHAVMTADYIAYPSYDDKVKGYIILN